jgi:hypothetical protein
MIGLVIRELFSFWTGHPTDFELWVRLGYAMNHGEDPYGVLGPIPGLSFANVFGYLNMPTIAYLPFWPIITGILYLLYSLIGWNNRFFYYFLLKQPIIFGDVGLAYLMFRYVVSRSTKGANWILNFWLFSPFTIIISSIWGMFDAIAICLVFLSVTATDEVKKVLWAGLGIFAKSIPIIYVAPTTMRRPKDWWPPLASIGFAGMLSLTTFIMMGWPFTVVTPAIVSTAIKQGWSMSAWDTLPYLTYLGYLPALNSQISLAISLLWVPAIIAFTWIAIKRFGTKGEYGLIQSLIVCTLAFLIFKAQVTEQYALYLFAFGAVDVGVWTPARRSLLLGTMIVALVYLIVNNYFMVRFLSPVYPGFASYERAINTAIGSIRNAVTFLSGTAFTCLNLKYLTDVLKRT